MKPLKIGIVEDNMLIAESIIVTLRQIGYEPTEPVRSYDDALKMIETESPDLLLLDISLDGKPDGIDLAAKIQDEYQLPYIFLTAFSDPATINRAKKVAPAAYLVKPFNEHDLFTSIEIAFNNFNSHGKNTSPLNTGYSKDIIFLKENELFHKVEINDIKYIESENVYLNIFTSKRNYVVRKKMDDFIDEIGSENLFKIHRSYTVNLKHLEAVNHLSVTVGGKEIPCQRPFKQDLLEKIKTMR